MNPILSSPMWNEAERKAFGERLKALRKRKHWTQKELAAKINLQLSQLNKYEAGMHVPPADKLVELAGLLDTTTDYLLTGLTSEVTPLQNRKLLERLRLLESFAPEDQETVIKLIDAMIVKHQVTGTIRQVNQFAGG